MRAEGLVEGAPSRFDATLALLPGDLVDWLRGAYPAVHRRLTEAHGELLAERVAGRHEVELGFGVNRIERGEPLAELDGCAQVRQRPGQVALRHELDIQPAEELAQLDELDLSTRPAAYALRRLLAGPWQGTLPIDDQPLTFALAGQNLTNARYRDYTSLLRYFADQPGWQVLLRVTGRFGAAERP